MTIYNVGELYEGRTSSIELPNVRRYTHVWRATTSDPLIGAVAVRAAIVAAANAPLGWPHPEDPGCFAKSIDCNCDHKDGKQWKATINYTNDALASDPDAGIENPVERRTKFRPSWVPYQEIAERDLSEPPKAVRNSAGGQFADPTFVERQRRRLTFIRNETDLPALEQYIGKTNSKKWKGYERGEVKLISADPSELLFEGEYAYYQVTYVFDVKRNHKGDDGKTVFGWDLELLDCGMYRVDDEGKKHPIYIGEEKRQATEPVNLNLAGEALEDQREQKWLVFRMHEEADFNKLNLEVA